MKRLRLFVAFASDCEKQSKSIHAMCRSDKTIRTLCRELEVSLDSCDFKDVSSDAGRPQSIINSAVDKWNPDWFIFLFWQRLGCDAGHGMTGMEEEWNRAIELNKQGGGYPRVSVYFNEAETNPYEADSVQQEALRRFREKIFGQYQALAIRFRGSRELSEQFHSDLSVRLVEVAKGEGNLDLEREFRRCSEGLLSWPRTVGSGDEIQRPELQEILTKVRTSNASTTLILGEPGSGKSALLAALGNACLGTELCILGIKADRLGKGVDSAEALRKHLQLSLETRDAIKRLASTKPLVLLLDQLDALSELVDRHSDRLNILLDLIQAVSGYSGVHIVASSRAFECHNDIRLNSLDADRLELQLPTWDRIEPILAKAGYDPTTIGNSTQDLLRSPLSLKVFLDVGKPDAVFSTLQSLLQTLWAKKVLVGEEARNKVKLIQQVAKKISRDEVFWVPMSLGDKWPAALHELLREEILSKGLQGLSLGFRHQTFYDFTLARAFAEGALSLSSYVKDRQNGLFVRPVLLNGLQYLRDTDSKEYDIQIKELLRKEIRLHIQSLLIEFIGSQKQPKDQEFSLLNAQLNLKGSGPRVLAAIAGSPGWFRRISTASSFTKWLRKPANEAIHALKILCQATQFDLDRVLNLIEKYWFPRTTHDELSLRVLSYVSTWPPRAIDLASRILRRKPDSAAPLIVDQATKSSPELATVLLRAALEGRLLQAQSIIVRTRQKRGLSRLEKLTQESKVTEEMSSLIKLIKKEDDWYNVVSLAEDAPRSFIDQVWPWFVKVVTLISEDQHEFVLEYRDDPATYNQFDGELPHGPIVKAILTAVERLAQQAQDEFVAFAQVNSNSDLLIVHRMLSRGFLVLGNSRPLLVLDYLLGDPRRLEIGDFADSHRESKALIGKLSSRLSLEELKPLEEAVINFKQYKKVMPNWTAKERFDRMKWARIHRLRLLRAFDSNCASEALRALRDQEERALPGVEDLSVRGQSGWVGSRLTAEEIRKSSDDDLLNLFNELPDKTGSDNPKRQWSLDFARSGGAWQLAREFGAAAKDTPDRVLNLLRQLKSGEHEIYAGQALEGLANADVPTLTLIACITHLNEKGFSSGAFREGAARLLKMRAGKENGLSQDILQILRDWLNLHQEPDVTKYKEQHPNEDVENGGEILFGHSPTWVLPHGRGPIIEAIAEGYLRQNPPNYNGWAEVIESRVGIEKHPEIWVMTLTRMPPLFNWDRIRATALYDAVVADCPDIMNFVFALYSIANILRLCEPKATAQNWLNILRLRRSAFSQQAYGEFLFLYHCAYNDSWSKTRFRQLLRVGRPSCTSLGLAHGASHLWRQTSCRDHANRVLLALASSSDPLIIRAVSKLFRLIKDEVELDKPLRLLISKLTKNRRAVLDSAEVLLDILAPVTVQEPKLLAEITRAILKFGHKQIQRFAWSTVPENLTSVALTLHRQEQFRMAGLKLFESLIEMNLAQAKSALDVLDRNPVVRPTLYRPTRLRRRRAVMRSGL